MICPHIKSSGVSIIGTIIVHVTCYACAENLEWCCKCSNFSYMQFFHPCANGHIFISCSNDLTVLLSISKFLPLIEKNGSKVSPLKLSFNERPMTYNWCRSQNWQSPTLNDRASIKNNNGQLNAWSFALSTVLCDPLLSIKCRTLAGNQ